MATFKEKLEQISEGKTPTNKSLTFLSDLSLEDRTTFREAWPKIAVARRRHIIETLVILAEDNIEYYFRPVFLAALEDPDATVRLASIEGLFEDESAMLLDRLLHIVRKDPLEDVREAAAKALGRFTYLSQCGKLGPGCNAAALRDTLVASATDSREDKDVRRRAVEALGYLNGDSQVQDLIADAYKKGGREAESALFAMGRNIDSRWESTVLRELESEKPAMRFEAARAAGEMALEDALSLLVRMVDDQDTEVRLAAVWALGQIGGKPAAEALAHALKSKDPALQEAAREALEEISFSANPLNVL
jgi:HEAT repeat protein